MINKKNILYGVLPVFFVIMLTVGLVLFFNRQLKKSHEQFIDPLSNNITTDAGSILSPMGSIEEIFVPDHSWIATLSSERKVTMLATGDVIPARSVNSQVVKRNDFLWPYSKTADVLKRADLTFINLETPLLENCPTTIEGMVFCGDAGNVKGLSFAGVDIASLANNHAGNYGIAGINFTSDLLQKNGIAVVGRDEPVVKELKGTRFAFLGYNDIGFRQDGLAWADEEKIAADIKKAKGLSDVVIVTYHWGVEYRDQPDERQRHLGHFTIDSGADLVIGNHPHWIQPLEIYKRKLITYAHGNFVFDQEWSLKTKQAVVGKYTFYDKQLVDVEYLPVLIENYGQPSFMEGREKNEILNSMKKQSEILQTGGQ